MKTIRIQLGPGPHNFSDLKKLIGDIQLFGPDGLEIIGDHDDNRVVTFSTGFEFSLEKARKKRQKPPFWAAKWRGQK